MLGRQEKGVPGSEAGRDIEVAGKKRFNRKVGIKTPAPGSLCRAQSPAQGRKAQMSEGVRVGTAMNRRRVAPPYLAPAQCGQILLIVQERLEMYSLHKCFLTV